MPDDPAERLALTHFLSEQRRAVLAIVDGLTEEALATAVLPSGWTPAGLVEHLGHAERHWFQQILMGAVEPLPRDGEEYAPLRMAGTVADAFAFYADMCARSDRNIAGVPLDAAPVGRHPPPLGDETTDLRRIILHMIEETARHAGHLDAARELLDGATGLGPR
jgi:hypothetical protein